MTLPYKRIYVKETGPDSETSPLRILNNGKPHKISNTN
jgi:hypothetical protein